MKVTIGKDDKKRRAVEVDNTVLLGKGGEKVVYADPSAPRSMAIAMYHQPSPQRAAKVRAFIDAPLKWPEHVIAPLEDVRDAKDQIVGFSMRQLNRRFVKFKNIFVPSWRRDHGVTTKVIAAKYLHVGDDLFNHIHKVGCVGDLNDGGLCLDEVNHAHAWVDVDSFKIGNSPCMVGQQLYLCPALYGIDLSTGNYFEPWHDGYSYCVLLFRSLLGQHPFKAGSHKAYADITDRARHGMTLMDKEVDRGNVKFYPDLLTDELMDAILQRLKLQDKTPFPLDRLQAYHDGLVACPSCKTEYPGSRKHCPACSTATTVNIKKIMGVELIELIAVSGHILHVQLDGNTIYCIAEEAGDLVVWIKDDQSAARRLKMGLKYRNGMRFAPLPFAAMMTRIWITLNCFCTTSSRSPQFVLPRQPRSLWQAKHQSSPEANASCTGWLAT
jgi:hypothetical protein